MNSPDLNLDRRRGKFDFLVVGAGRGGTSLLMALLDAHPDLEVGFEAHAIDCLMGAGLEVPAASIRGEVARYRCREFVRRCEGTAASSPGKIWGNKITTEQWYGLEDQNLWEGTSLNMVQMLLQELPPEMRFVFVLRDGRSVVRSKTRRTGQLSEHAVVRWKYALAVYETLKSSSGRVLGVRYEDLVLDTRATLRRVCEFLELPYAERMLEGTASEKIPPDYRSGGIRQGPLATRGTPYPLVQMMMSELLRYGYLSRVHWWWMRVGGSRYWRLAWPVITFCTLLACLFCGGL